MSARDWCRNNGVPLTLWQEWACAFLEMRGQRFLIDFVYENAEQKAEEITAKWWGGRTS